MTEIRAYHTERIKPGIGETDHGQPQCIQGPITLAPGAESIMTLLVATVTELEEETDQVVLKEECNDRTSVVAQCGNMLEL